MENSQTKDMRNLKSISWERAISSLLQVFFFYLPIGRTWVILQKPGLLDLVVAGLRGSWRGWSRSFLPKVMGGDLSLRNEY